MLDERNMATSLSLILYFAKFLSLDSLIKMLLAHDKPR